MPPSPDALLFTGWTRGAIIRTSDYVPAKLLEFKDPDTGRMVQASVWSVGPRGSLWVVRLDRSERGFTLVRKLNRTYVVDTRNPNQTGD